MTERIKTTVGAIADLPSNAGKPLVKPLTTSDPILLLGLKGNMGEHRLKQRAEIVRENLLDPPTVSQTHQTSG